MHEENEIEKSSDDGAFSHLMTGNHPGLVEVRTFIREDQAFALELIENAERQKRDGCADQAKLFQEALDLLIKERLIPIQLRRGQIVKN